MKAEGAGNGSSGFGVAPSAGGDHGLRDISVIVYRRSCYQQGRRVGGP